MNAYIIENVCHGRVEDFPVPEQNKNEILIKVMAAGLCGTDSQIFLGEYYSSFPIIPGHEFSGVVAKVGSEVSLFHEGQRVAADPNIFCEKCDYCKQNIQNFCRDFNAIGVTRNGAFAEYVVVPEACVFAIGEMDFSTAALIEPLACVVYGQQRARPDPGDNVLIFGAGPIGLLHLQLARHNGASFITVVDIRKERLTLSRELAADYIFINDAHLKDDLKKVFPDGFHLVIDTTGVPEVAETALGFVRNAGALLIFGVCPRHSNITFSPYEIYKRDLKIVGSFALKKTFQPAIALLDNRMVDVSKIIGERITLEQLPEYMERMFKGNLSMKTLIYPGGITTL